MQFTQLNHAVLAFLRDRCNSPKGCETNDGGKCELGDGVCQGPTLFPYGIVSSSFSLTCALPSVSVVS